MGWGKMAGGILAGENVRGDFKRQPPPDNCSLTTAPGQLPPDNCPWTTAPRKLPPDNCPQTIAPRQLLPDNCPWTTAPGQLPPVNAYIYLGGSCPGANVWGQFSGSSYIWGAVGGGQLAGGKVWGANFWGAVGTTPIFLLCCHRSSSSILLESVESTALKIEILYDELVHDLLKASGFDKTHFRIIISYNS